MKYLLCMIFALCSANAQTSFPTQVNITSNAAKTQGGELRVNNSTNTGYSSLTYANVTTGDVLAHVDNTYSIGTGSTRFVDQHLTGKTRYWYEPTGDFWDVKANGNGVFSILDSAGADIVRYIDIPASKWMFYHDVDPYGNNVVDLGDTSTAWKKLWTYDARLKSLGGGGTRCVQVDNNGDLSAFGAGCSGGMTNPMTTTYDMIYSNPGSTPVRLANPTLGGNYFLTSTAAGGPAWTSIVASSPITYSAGVFACATCVTSVSGTGAISSSGGTAPTLSLSYPAWTSYSPSITVASGSVSTTALSAAYLNYGKTTMIRIYWLGSITNNNANINFSTPNTVLGTSIVQAVAVLATDQTAGTVLGASGAGIGGSAAIQIANTASVFTGTHTFLVTITGTYENN